MTSAQRYKYFAEARKAVAAMRERGHQGTDHELRHQLTREALRDDTPLDAWTNREFDRVLAVLWSHSAAGDLAAQIDQIDQPIKRLEWLSRQHLAAAGIETGKIDWYLLGIGKRMFPGLPVYTLTAFTEEQWRDILVACNKHRQRVEKRKGAAAPF